MSKWKKHGKSAHKVVSRNSTYTTIVFNNGKQLVIENSKYDLNEKFRTKN